MAAQVLDRQDQFRCGRVLAGLVKQGRGAVRKAAQPCCVGRGVQQPGLAGRRRAPIGRPFERPGRDVVGAALAGPQAGLLKRGGGRFVGAERGQCQMPGAAIDVGVGQRAGEGAVHLAPLAGRGLAVDGRPGQRMPELDRSVAARSPVRPPPPGTSVGDVQAERGGGAGEHRHVAAVARRREYQGIVACAGEATGAEQVGLGDARPDGERRARRRVSERLVVAAEFDEGERVAAGLAGAGGRPGRA